METAVYTESTQLYEASNMIAREEIWHTNKRNTRYKIMTLHLFYIVVSWAFSRNEMRKVAFKVLYFEKDSCQ